MVYKHVKEGIIKLRQEGIDDASIRQLFLQDGYKEEDVEETFADLHRTHPVSAYALPGISELLKESWTIFTGHLGTFLGILIVFWLLSVIFYGFALAIGFFGGITVFATGNVTAIVLFAIFVLIIVCIGVMIGFWGSVAMMIAVIKHNHFVGVQESFRRGWDILGPYGWVATLVPFITLGGYFLFLIPGIIFIVWFIFAPFIVIIEGDKGMRALKKSRGYVRGHFVSITGRLLILLIPTAAEFALEGTSLLFHGQSMSISMSLLMSIIFFFLSPFFIVYLYVLYTHVVRLTPKAALRIDQQKNWPYVLIMLFPVFVIGLMIWGFIVVAIPFISKFAQQNKIYQPPTSVLQQISPSLQSY